MYVYACMNVCNCVYMHVCIVCMYVFVCVCTSVCVHPDTYLQLGYRFIFSHSKIRFCTFTCTFSKRQIPTNLQSLG